VETIRYTALSHSWGLGGIDFKLTENRLDEFQERIPFSNLPATHQDAVVLARKLGLQYAWIDSLCIIQDSTADCQTETVNMGDVYSNAYLTISTVSSPGSKVPFLEAQEAAYAAHPVQFYSPRLNYATRDILGFSGLRRTRLAQLRSHTTLYARRTQKLAAPSVDSAPGRPPKASATQSKAPCPNAHGHSRNASSPRASSTSPPKASALNAPRTSSPKTAVSPPLNTSASGTTSKPPMEVPSSAPSSSASGASC